MSGREPGCVSAQMLNGTEYLSHPLALLSNHFRALGRRVDLQGPALQLVVPE